MDFKLFLDDLSAYFGCKTATSLYKKLGGKNSLSMGIRQFQTIHSGQTKPTIGLLMAILRNVEIDLFRPALLSYFHSVSDEAADKKFLSYLSEGLRHSICPPKNSQFADETKIKLYTEEQILFLKSNPELMRLHQKVLLLNRILKKNENTNDMEILCKIGLAQMDGDYIISSANAFKIPTQFNSLPRTTSLSSEYIIEVLRTFLSFEGTENQKLEMVTQMISREHLPQILEETLKLKHWIQSLSQSDVDTSTSIPFIYICFSKALLKGEIA